MHSAYFRITRLYFVLAVASMVVVGSLAPTKWVQAQQRREAEQNRATNRIQNVQGRASEFWKLYRSQLQSVLRTRLQEEEDFVDQVVELVRRNRLPKSVVDRAWLWVRRHRAYSRYPFVYFERVLRFQADKLGLPIPEFDQSIYSRTSRSRRAANRARGRIGR